MTREEAIRILASSCISGSKQTEALETLIPELAESEDERMMREFNDWLCEEIECRTNDLRDEKDRRTLNMLCYILTKVKDWLEKQKEHKPVNHNFTTFHRDVVYCAMCDKNLDEGLRCNLEIVYKIIKDIVDRAPVVKEQRPISFYGHYNPDDYEVVVDGNATSLKKKEQKPAESISQLTVQGKGVYKICPRCKERMIRDNTKVYTSMPPQYGYKCPKCGEIEFDTAMYDNPEADLSDMMVHKEPYIAPVPTPMVADEQKPWEWSEEDRLHYVNVLEALEYVKGCKSDYDKIEAVKSDIAWFKSLKPSWKPSEEQMKALTNFIVGDEYDAHALAHLWAELKELSSKD